MTTTHDMGNLTVAEEDLFQKRAEEADQVARDLMAILTRKWSAESTDADGSFDHRLVINPALSGAVSALAVLAWDSAKEESSPHDVAMGFYNQARDFLLELQFQRVAGLLFRPHDNENEAQT